MRTHPRSTAPFYQSQVFSVLLQLLSTSKSQCLPLPGQVRNRQRGWILDLGPGVIKCFSREEAGKPTKQREFGCVCETSRHPWNYPLSDAREGHPTNQFIFFQKARSPNAEESLTTRLQCCPTPVQSGAESSQWIMFSISMDFRGDKT